MGDGMMCEKNAMGMGWDGMWEAGELEMGLEVG